MKRMSHALALFALVVLVLPGCYSMDIDATGLQPSVLMSNRPGQQPPQPLGQFEARTTGTWLLWGLLPLSPPNVGDAVQREITRANGTGVTGVEITTQQTVLDAIISTITLGIYGQRSTFVRGTVVR